MTHYQSNILSALVDAVVKVFWTKRDLRALLIRAGVPTSLVAAQDWEQYKFHILSPIVDELNADENGLGPLRRILQETLSFSDGDHLRRYSDGQRLKHDAEAALAKLRQLVQRHDRAHRDKSSERQERASVAEPSRLALFELQRSAINDRFLAAYANTDAQARGYDLETILYDIFRLHDLTTRGPFRRIGEQIDGAFVLDGQHYLLEAKWTKAPIALNDLRDLDGAVASSLDNTLGLFFSLNAFSAQALEAYVQGSRPKIICMDGVDLAAVLAGQIDLVELLTRKREVAVARRRIFVPVNMIMSGAA